MIQWSWVEWQGKRFLEVIKLCLDKALVNRKQKLFLQVQNWLYGLVLLVYLF